MRVAAIVLVVSLVILDGAIVVGQPRTVGTRVVIEAPSITNSLSDSAIAVIVAAGARIMSASCAQRHSYLDWRPQPSGASSGPDTIPLLTLKIVASESGKIRPDILAELLYCIDGSHDNRIVRARDKEVLFQGDESTPRTAAIVGQRLEAHLQESFGRNVPEPGEMRDLFVPRVVIADSLGLSDSTHADRVVLPVEASVLLAEKRSTLLAMFCTVVQGDTISQCKLVMNPCGKFKRLQSCKIVAADCGDLAAAQWMVAYRDRLSTPAACRVRIYMESYVFDTFGAPGGLDHD